MTNFSSKILWTDCGSTKGSNAARDGRATGSARRAGRECRDEPREINFSFTERGRGAMRVVDDDGDDGRASDRARRASRVDHANGRRPQARWFQRCVRDDATRDARRDEAKTLGGKCAHRSIDAACISIDASTPGWTERGGRPNLSDRYHLDGSYGDVRGLVRNLYV